MRVRSRGAFQAFLVVVLVGMAGLAWLGLGASHPSDAAPQPRPRRRSDDPHAVSGRVGLRPLRAGNHPHPHPHPHPQPTQPARVAAANSTTGSNPAAATAPAAAASTTRSAAAPALDAVIVAAYPDREPLLYYAIPSTFRHVRDLRNVYIVCEARLCQFLKETLGTGAAATQQRRVPDLPRDRLFVVPEASYPFSYADTKAVRIDHGIHQDPNDAVDRHGWTFQQLLKLFAPQVLRRPARSLLDVWDRTVPRAAPTILIADGDTVWLRPVRFAVLADGGPVDEQGLQQVRRCFYSVGAVASGSFYGDVVWAEDGVRHLLGQDRVAYWPKLASDQTMFTAITHHSVFQADVMEALLRAILERSEEYAMAADTWKVLATTRPWLSEYALYAAFAMARYPQRVVLRNLAYANAGSNTFPSPAAAPARNWALATVQEEGLADARTVPRLAYVSAHDNYNADARCCVNVYYTAKTLGCSPCSPDNAPQADVSRAVAALGLCQAVFPENLGQPPEAGDAVDAADQLTRYTTCFRELMAA